MVRTAPVDTGSEGSPFAPCAEAELAASAAGAFFCSWPKQRCHLGLNASLFCRVAGDLANAYMRRIPQGVGRSMTFGVVLNDIVVHSEQTRLSSSCSQQLSICMALCARKIAGAAKAVVAIPV